MNKKHPQIIFDSYEDTSRIGNNLKSKSIAHHQKLHKLLLMLKLCFYLLMNNAAVSHSSQTFSTDKTKIKDFIFEVRVIKVPC